MSELSLEIVRLRGRNLRPMVLAGMTTAAGGGVVVSSTPSPESLEAVLRVSWDEHVDEADDAVDDDFAGGLSDGDDVVAGEVETLCPRLAAALVADASSAGGAASSAGKHARSVSMRRSSVSLSTKSSHL